MMITIHGFPAKTKYQDVKILVKQECNINDFILDNLVNDQDGTKKVRIGLTDNSEGYRLMKCLDGYRMAGNFVLKAVPVGKAAATLSQPAPFETQPSYQNQPRSDYSNAPRNDYIRPTNEYSDQGPHGGPHSHAAQVHGGPHSVAGPHNSAPHGARASHIQSVPHGSGHQGGIDPMGRPSPWATASSNQNQWSSNAPVAAQVPQNTYSYNSTQAVNPGFGHQHQGHPRPEMRAGFNQGRGPDQGCGFPAKSNIPEGPANSRYRWTKIKKTEPELWNLPEEEEESSDHPSVDSSDDDEPPSKEALESLLAQATSQNTDPDDPNDQKPMSNKERKKKENAWRNLSKLRAVDRRRLSWWLKRGKTFREARALCETHVKKCPEYAEARKFKLEKSRLKRLRQLAPEDQARFLRLKELLGPLGTAGHAIRLRVFDNLGEMAGEQVDMIYDKILELMEAENEENRPKLSSIRGPRAGGINMNCADQKSIDWLKNSLKDLQLWEGAQLQVVNVNEMPKTIIGVAFVPDPNLHDVDIFDMLKSQNPGIDFNDWWITQAKMLPPNGQTVTFNISHNSIADLDAQNYNVFLGHKKIKIRIKSKNFVPGLGPIGGGPSTSTKKPHKGSVTQLRPPVKGKPPKQNQKQGGPKQNNYHIQTGPFGKPSKKNRQQGESQARSFGPSHQNQGRGRPNIRQQGGPKSGKFKHTGSPGGFKPQNQNQNPQGPPGIQGKGKKKKSKGKKKPPQTSAQNDHNPDGLWNSWLEKNESSVK